MAGEKDKTAEVSQRAVIFANGPVPPAPFVKQFLHADDLIACADGGANRIVGYGFRPHVIIGDLDSVSMDTVNHFEGARIIRNPDQETNDLHKALTFVLGKEVEEALVFGATGARHDQFLANLSLLKEFHFEMDVKFIDEYSVIVPVTERFEITGEIGRIVSLWPLTEKAQGVTTAGMKYPLNNETLYQDSRGLSNELAQNEASVTLTAGMLIAICHHSRTPQDSR